MISYDDALKQVLDSAETLEKTIVPVEKNSLLISVMAPFAFLIGAGIVPQILGIFGDSSLYAEGFIFFGLLTIFGAITLHSKWIYRYVEANQKGTLEA